MQQLEDDTDFWRIHLDSHMRSERAAQRMLVLAGVLIVLTVGNAVLALGQLAMLAHR